MEDAWPAVARDEKAPRAMREWAPKLEAKPKYVVSASRRDFPWKNTFRLEGDLHEAVKQLKEKSPQGVLVGSPKLSTALEQLGLIDEYRLVVHPVLAGHGPTLLGAVPDLHPKRQTISITWRKPLETRGPLSADIQLRDRISDERSPDGDEYRASAARRPEGP